MEQEPKGFPKFGTGFEAEIATPGQRLLLRSRVEEEGWWAQIYDRQSGRELLHEEADNAEDGKQKAEQVARHLIPGSYDIEWEPLS